MSKPLDIKYDLTQIPKDATILVRPASGLSMSYTKQLIDGFQEASRAMGFKVVILDPSVVSEVSILEEDTVSDEMAKRFQMIHTESWNRFADEHPDGYKVVEAETYATRTALTDALHTGHFRVPTRWRVERSSNTTIIVSGNGKKIEINFGDSLYPFFLSLVGNQSKEVDMHENIYFVMLRTQGGSITPMTEDDGEIATFSSVEDARACAKTNILGTHFGYEIFCDGQGEE